MKGEYKVGDWVEVTGTVTFSVDKMERKPIRKILRQPFTAQIIGAAYRQVGIYHPGVYDPYNGEGPPYLECKGTVLVWLVRRGVTNRQVEVLPADLTFGVCKVGQCLPWRYITCTKEDRKAMSRIMRDIKLCPRNSHGQFIKVPEME